MTESVFPIERPTAAIEERPFAILRWLHRSGFAIGAYVVAMLLTGATTTGDTVDYVESIVLFSRGVNHWMWDFAHLLWRPLGWILYVVFAPVMAMFVGNNERLQVMLTLTAISWLAGLASVILVHALARHVSGRTWIANAVALAFVFSYGFLNFAHAGTAYIAAMALVLCGFYLLIVREQPILAGIALGAAVCLWVPYMFAVPAAIAAPLLIGGLDSSRVRMALRAAVASALVVSGAYLTVIAVQDFHTLGQIWTWIAWSSHGTDFGGAKRVVFGFARTFVDMGADGLLFKRYLLKDPFNPVSLRDLLVASLWKIAAFYTFFAAVVIALFYSRRSRRVLALLLLNAIPVIGFATLFAGSDAERYFALYPAFFLSIASGLSNRSARLLNAITIGFVALLIVVNSSAMARPRLDRQEESAASRVRDLLPLIDERTLVLVPNWQDDLINFTRAHPFHPVNRSGRFHAAAMVTPGTSWNTHWREDFADNVLAAWKHGGAVWIADRAFSPKPRAEWNWAEGDDRRVSWKDFPALLGPMDFGERAGGFVLLVHSTRNEQLLKAIKR